MNRKVSAPEDCIVKNGHVFQAPKGMTLEIIDILRQNPVCSRNRLINLGFVFVPHLSTWKGEENPYAYMEEWAKLHIKK